MTDTRSDEKIARLIAEHGMAGYGLWWMVLEIVASQMQKDSLKCDLTYPVSTWSHLLSVRGSHVRQAMLKLSLTGLVTAEWSGSELTVRIPNLLKYRDEYTSRIGRVSGDCREQEQRQNTDTDTDTDNREKSETDFSLSGSSGNRKNGRKPKADWTMPEDLVSDFAEWWKIVPRKEAKPQAQRAYATHRAVGVTHEQVMQAQRRCNEYLLTRDVSYRPLGASWMNQQHWLDEKSPEATKRPEEMDELDRLKPPPRALEFKLPEPGAKYAK